MGQADTYIAPFISLMSEGSWLHAGDSDLETVEAVQGMAGALRCHAPCYAREEPAEAGAGGFE